MKKLPQETYINNTAKSKSTSKKLTEEICFILKIYYSSEQKKVVYKNKKSISWQTIGKQKRRERADLFQGDPVFT